MKVFPAHIRNSTCDGEDRPLIQPVQEHCRRSAEIAGACLQRAGLYHAAYLAGLVHDCGKFTEEFSTYIERAYRGEPVQRGSVNHTFAGCRLLLEHFHAPISTDYRDVTAELLAYAVGAHHGQFDCIDGQGNSGFAHRMQAAIHYEEAKSNFLKLCADWTELEEIFEKAHEELVPIYEKIGAEEEQQMFCLGQLARLLLSAVMEGDRRDTAEFMDGRRYPTMQTGRLFWESHLEAMEGRLEKFQQTTPIGVARSRISALCREAAGKPEGTYRLNVPTGGGKTLSALRYALAHAAKWGKRRIVFVTPLLTILEQNAAVICEFIGDDAAILEHHSNVLHTREDSETLDLQELAVDSWEAPVIITTLVQLLNTLFQGKTTSIRRYEALCDAVIVIDEVQTVPNRMLSLFNTAVNFLSRVCRTTFLFCSATQPCFEKAEHPLFLGSGAQLVPYQEELWKPFRRTVIQDSGAMRLEQIPAFVQQILRQTKSLLIICNKKSESEYLYQHIASAAVDCFHLSSSMCMAHRRAVLENINASLAANAATDRKTICVSTQVMEAGVDISFGCVIRLAAGMDSVVQSAGRCNRNGESNTPVPVYVLQCADENLGQLREIREGKKATIALLHQFQREPEKFEKDLASDQAVAWYYQKLYQNQCPGYQQYTVESGGTIYDMLSWNDGCVDADTPAASQYTLRQAFKTAGDLFEVMDDSAQDVVVPYGDGEKLIRELEQLPEDCSPAALRSWSQRVKPYTISMYPYQKDKLAEGLRSVRGVLVLQPEYYHCQTGLVLNPESAFLEV